MSSVPGAATMPITEIAVRMFSQLSHERKYSDLTEKKTHSATRNTSKAVVSGSRLAMLCFGAPGMTSGDAISWAITPLQPS
jgi:hypothetical protein